MASWRTSLAGILAIVCAVAGAAQGALQYGVSAVDLGGLIAAIVAGIGLIKARDNAVSSEAAGVKPPAIE